MRQLLMGIFILFLSTTAVAETSDDQLEKEAQALLSQELKPEVTETTTGSATPESQINIAETAKPAETKNVVTNKKESEIPVLTKEKPIEAKTTSAFMKMLLSLGIVAVVGIGLLIAAKKFGWKRNQISAQNQIKVLTQHHLGPKKSLMIIRVAGESILIGITDQNINMIKSLALMDEEIAEMAPQDFEESLNQYGSEPNEDFAFGNVKDRVSVRMKEMRRS